MVKYRQAKSPGDELPQTPRSRATKVVNGEGTPSGASTTTPRSTRKRKEVSYKEQEVAVKETSIPETSKSSARKRKISKVEAEVVEGASTPSSKRGKVIKVEKVTSSKASRVKAKPHTESEDLEALPQNSKEVPSLKAEPNEVLTEDESKKPKRKRKTKEEKEAEAMPLASRTQGLRMFFGAHVSCAKGVQNGVLNCLHIGGNAFAMFLKSQRKWENPPLLDKHRDQYKAFCIEHGYDAAKHVLPHGSYLVNLANPDPEASSKAFSGFIDDLHRCEALGIKLYNFHPGTTGPHPRPEAIGRIAAALNKAHSETKTVVPLLENMATAGSNVVGSSFEDLRDIIAQVKDKSRIGVCLDTCHAFAAGYDLRSPESFHETLSKFDDIIGMKYLKALHLNDSKAPFAAGRDLHQNIGVGFLGLRAFHNVANEKRFEGLPLVLETPIDAKDENGKDIEDKRIWANEIKLLEELIGMDPSSARFKGLEKELADKGAEERAKYEEAFQRKKAKAEKGQTKLSFGKARKKGKEVEGSESEG